MKQFITILCMLAAMQMGAQKLQVALGKVTSNFSFENAQGQELENLNAQSNTGFELEARLPLSGEQLHLRTGLRYTSYGSQGSDMLNNFFKWETDYAGVYAGLDYAPLQFGDFNVVLSGGMSVQFLVQGEQVTNNTVSDLKGVGEFDNTAIFGHVGLGVEYQINDRVGALICYEYSSSLALKEDTAQGTSELKIKASTLSLGLTLALGNNKQSIDTKTE